MDTSESEKIILVPLDFSDASERALEQAARMAKAMGARLILLHVIAVDLVFEGATAPIQWRIDEKVHEVERKLRELADLHLGSGIEYSVVALARPKPARAIVEYAADIGSDLILMGTHQRRGLSHVLLGSVAESVLRRTGCPVMLVGPGLDLYEKAA